MSFNTFGHLFRVTTWGESHGPAIGATVDGSPPGVTLSEADLQPWLDRRKPGPSKFTTQRKEPVVLFMMQTELFSKREKEVIELLLQGKSNKQIAAALGISKSTVEYHLKNIYRKLDVVSRAEAILHLSNNRLRETTGSIDKGNLWLHIGEITSKIGYSSQAKQFFDSKEEKAMKNRTMFSIFLSVIALAMLLG